MDDELRTKAWLSICLPLHRSHEKQPGLLALVWWDFPSVCEINSTYHFLERPQTLQVRICHNMRSKHTERCRTWEASRRNIYVKTSDLILLQYSIIFNGSGLLCSSFPIEIARQILHSPPLVSLQLWLHNKGVQFTQWMSCFTSKKKHLAN